MKLLALIKIFFSHKTQDTTYRFELIRLAILVVLWVLDHTNEVFFHLIAIPAVLSVVILVAIYVLILLSFIRLIKITDNREKHKKCYNHIKRGWSSYEVLINEFLDGVAKLDVTMTFEISYKETSYLLNVWVDMNSKRTEYEINGLSFVAYSEFEKYIYSLFPYSKYLPISSIEHQNPEKYWRRISK